MGNGQLKQGYNKARWQVERERCRIEDAEPSSADPGVIALSDVMAVVLKRLGLEKQQWYSILTDEWKRIVGEAISKHTRPGRIEGQTLIIYVDNSVWLSELSRFSSGELLAKIKERFGSGRIGNIRLQLDPEGSSHGTQNA